MEQLLDAHKQQGTLKCKHWIRPGTSESVRMGELRSVHTDLS